MPFGGGIVKSGQDRFEEKNILPDENAFSDQSGGELVQEDGLLLPPKYSGIEVAILLKQKFFKNEGKAALKGMRGRMQAKAMHIQIIFKHEAAKIDSRSSSIQRALQKRAGLPLFLLEATNIEIRVDDSSLQLSAGLEFA